MANQLDNLKGEQFGFLSVVERLPNDEYGNVWWKCTCVCGAKKFMRASQLRKGKFFHCGRTECRFWSKVYKAPGAACWQWVGAVNDSGYGRFRNAGQTLPAHQFAWVFKHGPVPSGKLLMHKCDNRACVRPDHLEVGTHQQNMDDMVSKGRAGKGGSVRHLTEDVVRELRREYRTGDFTQKQLAEKLGLSVTLVRRALNGTTWAQVH